MELKKMIQELLTLEEIEHAEEEYEAIYGVPPFSLSTWNPSLYYRKTYLFNRVLLPLQTEFIDYIYSYDLDSKLTSACREKIAGTTSTDIVVTNSGTASISLVTSVLSAMGLRRIMIVSPVYFAVLYNCTQKQLDICETHMIRSEDGYHIPREVILKKNFDVLWLTNPVYNTSVYMNDDDCTFLQEHILPKAYLVVDECFCKSGAELSRKFLNDPHFIGIYDPMKQFLINGSKFSVITIPPNLGNIFYQWSDVVCGGLTASTVQAMKFFLSPESNNLLQTLQQADMDIQKEVRIIASKYSDTFLDNNVDGHMMMCYLPKLKADYLNTFRDFCRFQAKTGVSIIPGSRFHFPNEAGFMFRINLARYDSIRFGAMLKSVLSYLTDR